MPTLDIFGNEAFDSASNSCSRPLDGPNCPLKERLTRHIHTHAKIRSYAIPHDDATVFITNDDTTSAMWSLSMQRPLTGW